MLNRSTLLLAICGLLFSSASLLADDLVITKTEPAKVAIVLPDAAANDSGYAKFASLLQKRFEQAMGRQVRVVKQSAAGQLDLAFNIGPTDACKAAIPDQDKLPTAGYVVKTDGKSNVFFAAKDEYAVGFGVVEFLDKVMNCRQYMPAPLGECITQTDKLTIPGNLDLESKPVLASVYFSGLQIAGHERNDAPYKEMEVALQLYWLDQFHHAFFKIIPPEIYGNKDKHPETYHPEWYPMVQGQRRVPDGKHVAFNSAWQPDLSNPEFFQRTVDYCLQYFDEHPQMTSVSIAINDGGGWGQPTPEELKIANQWPGHWETNLMYDFVNRVARAIAKARPGKSVGLSAYGLADFAPPFKLEHNVLVYKVHPDPEAGLKPWADLGAATGVYTWLYGPGYVTPRYFPHVFARLLKHWIDQGAQGLYAEAYANWIIDAPQYYAVSKIARNPDVDVDALLVQFAKDMYGQEAAPSIVTFYKTVETAMDRRANQKRNQDDYTMLSNVNRPARYQFDCWRLEDVAAMDAALAEAGKHIASGSMAAKRFELLTQWWDWSREYILCYASAAKISDTPVASEADVKALIPLLAQVDQHRDAVTQQWDKNMAHIDTNDATIASRGIYMRNTLNPAVWQSTEGIWLKPGNWAAHKIDEALFHASDTLVKADGKDATIAFWNKLADENPSAAAYLRPQAVILAADSHNLVDNGSFETISPFKHMGKWTMPEGYVLWNGHNNAVTEDMGVDDKVFRTGTHSWCSGQGNAGWLDRTVSVTPGGRYLLSVWVRQVNPENNVTLNGVTFAKDGGILDNVRINNRDLPALPQANTWFKLETILTIPAWGDKLGIDIAATNDKEGEITWFDDLSLIRLY